MIDFELSRPHRFLLLGFRSAMYGAVVAAGVWALVAMPRTIAGASGVAITVGWAILAILGGVAALIGVLRGSLRLEFLAFWWAAGGVSAYVMTVWSLVLTETATRGVQAWVCTGFLFALCYRGAELAAHISRMRKLRDSMEG